jgi:hypothetical protein
MLSQKQIKMENKKIYQLYLAKNYLSTHPKKGRPTNFLEAVKQGKKKHTIRGNYTYWDKIVKQVNESKAVLSVRQWTGKPYYSSPVEVFQVHKITIEPVHFEKPSKANPRKVAFITIAGVKKTGVEFDKVARNDGFDLVEDFLDWFPYEFDGCILHFDEIVWEK